MSEATYNIVINEQQRAAIERALSNSHEEIHDLLMMFRNLSHEEELVCTCTKDCPLNCKGECGCEKCRQAYQDFLSLE